MNKLSNEALSGLRLILRDEGIITTPTGQDKFLTDWNGKTVPAALAVLLPRTVEEVSGVLGLLHKLRIPVTAQGGRTGVTGATFPGVDTPSVILSLERMNCILEMDSIDHVAVVEAGCILQVIQESALDKDCEFPLSFGAEGSCQIGGAISTNAGGSMTIRYGNTRDLILGIEAVLPDGSIIRRLDGLRKDNRGFNWCQTMIGAEGSLGVITKAALKLFPRTRDRHTALLKTRNYQSALQVFKALKQFFPEHLSAAEIFSESDLDFAQRSIPDLRIPCGEAGGTYLLVEVSTASEKLNIGPLFEECTEVLFEKGLLEDGVISQNEQQSSDFWRLRESLPESASRSADLLVFDLAVRVSKLPGFIDELREGISSLDSSATSLAYGHLGDGNIHVNVCWDFVPTNFTRDEVKSKICDLVYGLVARSQGTFSAEHGIGRLKIDYYSAHTPKEEIEIMRRIKNAFDPSWLMNDGVIVKPD